MKVWLRGLPITLVIQDWSGQPPVKRQHTNMSPNLSIISHIPNFRCMFMICPQIAISFGITCIKDHPTNASSIISLSTMSKKYSIGNYPNWLLLCSLLFPISLSKISSIPSVIWKGVFLVGDTIAKRKPCDDTCANFAFQEVNLRHSWAYAIIFCCGLPSRHQYEIFHHWA